MHHGQSNRSPDLDASILSDLIYELNIARRHLSLYPAEHPLIESSTDAALEMLHKLCEFRDSVTLGVAPDGLLFEQEWLDRKNPVFVDFARFLATFEIASISFSRELAGAELIRFNQLLRSDRATLHQAGGFQQLLEEQRISHISLTLIDYNVFQTRCQDPLPEPPRSAGVDHLWEDFLQGLLTGRLDSEGESVKLADRLDPVALAETLNQRHHQKEQATADYDQVISSFVAQLKSRKDILSLNNEQGNQLESLLGHLIPDLRRQFLNSTFRALDRHPDSARLVLQKIPRELLIETLERQNAQQLTLSNRLIDILGHLSANAPATVDHRVQPGADLLPEDVLRARLEILCVEDRHDEFIPDSYQEALQGILNGEVKGTVPVAVALRLKNTLEKQSVERQCCAIIFNMLRHRVDAETENLLQDNLTELSRYFLDTGDFATLKDIFVDWSGYLYSGVAKARFLDEKVLSGQTHEAFMEDVLDGVELWGPEKYTVICSYITEVGEPYAELLVERLGNEPRMSMRHSWMNLLVELGDKGHQIITAALQDERWYLVRNLLIVLGKQRNKLPLKEIQSLAGHDHPRVRQEVLRILFGLRLPIADRLLLKELSGYDHQILLPAVQLAELSRDAEVLDRLHQLLIDEGQSGADLEFRKQLLATLARIGSGKSIPVLRQLLQKKSLLWFRRLRELQLEIIATLGNYPREAVESLLQELKAGKNGQITDLATEQLRRLGIA